MSSEFEELDRYCFLHRGHSGRCWYRPLKTEDWQCGRKAIFGTRPTLDLDPDEKEELLRTNDDEDEDGHADWDSYDQSWGLPSRG